MATFRIPGFDSYEVAPEPIQKVSIIRPGICQ